MVEYFMFETISIGNIRYIRYVSLLPSVSYLNPRVKSPCFKVLSPVYKLTSSGEFRSAATVAGPIPRTDTRRSLNMNNSHRDVDVEERRIEKKSDSSLVASTFIKYAAYIIIIFGILYFLVRYVFPMFQ